MEREEFKERCRKCGGRVFKVPGSSDPIEVKCEECGHGAFVVEAKLAVAGTKALEAR